jgi:hypothetical protein
LNPNKQISVPAEKFRGLLRQDNIESTPLNQVRKLFAQIVGEAKKIKQSAEETTKNHLFFAPEIMVANDLMK